MIDVAIETLTGVPMRSSIERAGEALDERAPQHDADTPITTRMRTSKMTRRKRRKRMNTDSGGGRELGELLFGIVMPQPAVVIPRSARNLHRRARRDRLLARRPAGERVAHRLSCSACR